MGYNREDYREFDRHARSSAPRIFGVSLTIFVLVILLIVLAGVFTWFWAPWKGKVEQRQQTEGSGAYRIASYDSFYDDCQAVVAAERKIALQQEQADTATGDQKAILEASLLGLRNTREDLIAEYNANSRKADTRANFKASDLPYQIDPTQETTTCEA